MDEMVVDELKKYILSDFRDEKHKRDSLVDIFRKDRKGFQQLKKEHKIRPDVEVFFSKCERRLNAAESISVDAFRRLKYEQIIEEYVKKVELEKRSDSSREKKKSAFRPAEQTNQNCDTYVNSKQKNNGGASRKIVISAGKKKCYVFGMKKPIKCVVEGGQLEKVKARVKLENGAEQGIHVGWCSSCGMMYISLEVYELYKNSFECQNTDAIEFLREEIARKEKGHKTQKTRREISREHWLENQRKQKQLRIEQQKKLAQLIKEKEAEKQIYTEQKKESSEKNSLPPIYAHDNTICVKDFVVRRSVFRCMHNDHKLKNINAVISIINKDGNIVQTSVTAGYCPDCNTFFIMESTYEKLKLRGTPICRVSDEKSYFRGSNYVGGMKLSQESVLMQYGYSVSQQEGLTMARRHKILAVLIDNDILTKSEIISYLDFFITQRRYRHGFEIAISKWENDREFVADYKKDGYTRYGVKGIYRNL